MNSEKKNSKIKLSNNIIIMGGGQNLERPNVQRPIFRKFETSNTEITKVELFDFSICLFISINICLFISLKINDNLPN